MYNKTEVIACERTPGFIWNITRNIYICTEDKTSIYWNIF